MYTTQQFQRTVYQPATGVGALGAVMIAVCPPLGILLLILAFVMQRNFTKARKSGVARAQRRAAERADMARIIALKSLR
jgi:hypothetical protein